MPCYIPGPTASALVLSVVVAQVVSLVVSLVRLPLPPLWYPLRCPSSDCHFPPRDIPCGSPGGIRCGSRIVASTRTQQVQKSLASAIAVAEVTRDGTEAMH